MALQVDRNDNKLTDYELHLPQIMCSFFFFLNSRSSCCQITGGWGLAKSLNVIRSVGADKATFWGAAELKVGEMGREGEWAAPGARGHTQPPLAAPSASVLQVT